MPLTSSSAVLHVAAVDQSTGRTGVKEAASGEEVRSRAEPRRTTHSNSN